MLRRLLDLKIHGIYNIDAYLSGLGYKNSVNNKPELLGDILINIRLIARVFSYVQKNCLFASPYE